MKESLLLRSGSLLLAALFPAVPLFAQEEAPETETIELSPFSVETSRDFGYLATNSISGTRLNMEIQDVPLNLEVVTREFIEDTGATDLREALRYSAGLVLSSQSDAFANVDSDPQSSGANDPRGVTRRAGDSTTKLRGFIGDSMLQDGFHRVYSADTVNIERIEVLRGPSALLYGTGNFGGVVNFVTKKPHFEEDFYHLGTMVGSNDLLRFQMDANVPLVGKDSTLAAYEPAIRMTAAWQENGDFTEHYEQEHWQLNGVLTFRPWENTLITISGELGEKSEYGVGFQNIRNSFGGLSANRAYLWLTDTYDEETGVKTGETVNNRTFRWSGDDSYLKGPFENLIVDLEQKISENLYFKAGYARSSATFESRMIDAWVTSGGGLTAGSGYTSRWTGREIPDRTPALWSHMVTASFGDVEAGESPDSIDNAVIQYEWVDVDRKNERDQIRAELVYKMDTGRWGNHTFILGANYQHIEETENIHRPGQTFVTSRRDANGIVRNGSTFTVNTYDRFSYHDIDDHSYFVYGSQGDGYADNPQVHWTRGKTESWDAGYYAVYQGQFFNDRLTVVGGARWDRVDESGFLQYPWANELSRQGVNDWGKATELTGRTDDEDAPTATSPQLGASYALTDEISVFGVFSTGVVPNFNHNDGYDRMLDPSDVENVEIGAKFQFFGGKLSGTVSAYRIKRENVAKFIWWAPNPAASISSGYDPEVPTRYTAKYTTPAGFYAGLFESGLDRETAVATAKEIWGEAWHSLIDEVSSIPYDGSTLANDFDYAAMDGEGNPIYPLSAGYWDFYDASAGATTIAETKGPNAKVPSLYYMETGHDNSRLDDEVWYPLIEWGMDDTVDQFMSGVLFANGWVGNYGQATNGQSYKYGDGTIGTANASTSVGAWVPMSDEAEGVDIQVTWIPFPELQIVASYSHLKRVITSKTYQLVSARFAPGAEWLKSDYAAGTLDPSLKVTEVYEDIDDASTYHATIPDTNQAADDSPENTFNIWARYELSHMMERASGWAIGAGLMWQDERMWYSGFMGDGNASYVASTRTLVQYFTETRTTVNAMLEYKTRFAERYDTRFALNVDNLFDDEDIYGLVYAPGRSVRFSVGVDF